MVVKNLSVPESFRLISLTVYFNEHAVTKKKAITNVPA